jgi:predicted nucleic acid-binding protein
LTIYADSSFLVSSYIQDLHSAEAVRRMASLPSVWITPFNRAELAHAIDQYVFRGDLSSSEAKRYWSQFLLDCNHGVWIPINLPEKVWETSIALALRHGPTLGVRTLDSLHVACALELAAQKFWTFDDRQGRLAEAVGLDTTP